MTDEEYWQGFAELREKLRSGSKPSTYVGQNS